MVKPPKTDKSVLKQRVIYMTSGPFHNIKLSQNVRIELNINFPQKIKKCTNMIFQNYFYPR